MPWYTDGPIGADAGLQDLAPSLGMSVGAAVEDAFTSNPTTVVYDYSRFSRANDGPRLAKSDAEGRVKSAGVSLKIPDEGYSEDALNLLIDRKRDEITRQSILARAPAGIIPSTARFSASLLTGVLDPLNVASAFVPVVGEARYMEMLAKATGAIGRAGVRAGVGAAEGLVGAALVEPINYFGRTQMQDDYHMTDSLLNLAMGAGLGGVLHTGGGAIGDKLGISEFARSLEVRRAEEALAAQLRAEAGKPDEPISLPGLSAKQAEAIDRVHQEMGTGKYAPESAAARAAEMTPEGREATMRVAVAQAMEGRIPDVELIHRSDVAVAERSLSDDPQRWEYRTSTYEAGEHVADAPGGVRIEYKAPDPRFPDDMPKFTALDEKGGVIGEAHVLTENGVSKGTIEVAPWARRQGVATSLYVAAEKKLGVQITPEPRHTQAAEAFWQQPNRPFGPDYLSQARATAERQASPESIAVADFNAARAADERIAAEAKTDPAQALLDSTTAKLDALLKNLEQRGMDPARIEAMRAELAPFDEALADSKKLGAAMKAAAICGIQ